MPTAAATATAHAIAAKMAASAENPYNPAQVILDDLRRQISAGEPAESLLETSNRLSAALLAQRGEIVKERLEAIMALCS
jgi:hypothetical protein